MASKNTPFPGSRFLILSELALVLSACSTTVGSANKPAPTPALAAVTASASAPVTMAAPSTPPPISNNPPALMTTPAVVLVDFNQTIKPIFAQYCYKCHGPDRQINRIRFDSKANIASHGGFITPGVPNRSEIYIAMTSPDGHMPPLDQPQPTANDIAMMKLWITQGGVWPDASARQ